MEICKTYWKSKIYWNQARSWGVLPGETAFLSTPISCLWGKYFQPPRASLVFSPGTAHSLFGPCNQPFSAQTLTFPLDEPHCTQGTQTWFNNNMRTVNTTNKGEWKIQIQLSGKALDTQSQSWPTLFDPMDCSRPETSAHKIFQARIPEWVAILFSRDRTQG